MPRIPTVQVERSAGVLKLPRAEADSFGAQGFAGATRFGVTLGQIDARLQAQQEELDVVRLAGDLDRRLDDAKAQVIDQEPDVLKHVDTFKKRAQEEAKAIQDLTTSSVVRGALAKHALQRTQEVAIHLQTEGRQRLAERQKVELLQRSETLADEAATTLSKAEADEKLVQQQVLSSGMEARGILKPSEREAIDKATNKRYWEGVAQRDPETFLEATKPGQELPESMDKGLLHHYRQIAVWEQSGRRAEAKRVEAEQEKTVKVEQKATQEDFTTRITKGVLTTDAVLHSNLDPVGPGSKEHYIQLMEARAKEAERLAEKAERLRKDPSVFLGVLEDIRAGRITTEQQVEGVYARSVEQGRGIDWTDTVALRKEVDDLRTPEGSRLGRTKAAFLDGVKTQIDKSNPLMGKIDNTGRQKFYEYSFYVDAKVDEYRRAGKDPHELFVPDSPAYLGRPQVLSPFQKTILDSARDVSNRLRSQSTAVLPTGAIPKSEQRQEGESIDDYLKRTKKK